MSFEQLIAQVVRAVVREELAAVRQQTEAAHKAKHYTVREGLELLKCSDRTFRRMLAMGRLERVQLGTGKRGKVLVTADSLEAVLAGRR